MPDASYFAAAAAIAAAIIAFFSVWFQIRNLSTAKLAEFRLRWINDLREELSEFVGILKLYRSLCAQKNDYLFRDNIKLRCDIEIESQRVISKARSIYSYASLCLDTDKKSHKKILCIMNSMLTSSFDDCEEEGFYGASRKVLDDEWEKLSHELLSGFSDKRRKRGSYVFLRGNESA
ncbi:hypothetical protein [Afifella marina]|uniref:hypothetical protein n=1 Tax=Afifella marina TaxID=1080 RepID=UPI0011134980|nr:hypothetical protein [Afifella marina]